MANSSSLQQRRRLAKKTPLTMLRLKSHRKQPTYQRKKTSLWAPVLFPKSTRNLWKNLCILDKREVRLMDRLRKLRLFHLDCQGLINLPAKTAGESHLRVLMPPRLISTLTSHLNIQPRPRQRHFRLRLTMRTSRLNMLSSSQVSISIYKCIA